MKSTAKPHFQFAQGPQVNLELLLKLRYPARIASLFKNKSTTNQYAGTHRSRFKGRGMDFDEVRIYQPGDDIRTIDWRVTARTTNTYTKIYKEEKERPVLICIDQRRTMGFGTKTTYKSAMAAQLASLLAWSALHNNDKVGGIVFNEQSHSEIKPLNSNHSLLLMLNHICDYNQSLISENSPAQNNTQYDIRAIMEKIHRMAKPGTAVFFISDFFDYGPETEKLLHLIKRHTDFHALIVTDPMERDLPVYGYMTVTDGEHKHRINTKSKKLRDAYQQTYDKHRAFVNRSFQRMGVSKLTIATDDHPLDALHKISNQAMRPTRSAHHK